MEMHQEFKNIDDMLPVLTFSVNQISIDKSSEQTTDKYEFPIELTNITGTHVEDMNDYCLSDIFSVNSLELMDWCSIAETCTRFQEIMRRVVAKKFSVRYINAGNYEIRLLERRNTLITDRHGIERIFKIFGPNILSTILIGHENDEKLLDKAILIDDGDEEALLGEAGNILFDVVTRYCVNNLESLAICDSDIPRGLFLQLKPIFRRLLRLSLCNLHIEGDEKLFQQFESLVRLQVTRVSNDHIILGNHFPKLEHFMYEPLFDFDSINHFLTTFIQRHGKLKILDLSICSFVQYAMIISELIGRSCLALEELKISGISPIKISLQALQEMKSLQTLKLERLDCEDFEFVSALTNLNELRLHKCRLPINSNQLDFLIQLTKLEIYSYKGIDVVDIITRLVNLEKLRIYEKQNQLPQFVLDEESFEKIVDIVRRRQNVLTLSCEFNFELKNFDDTQGVRLLRERRIKKN